MGSLRVAARPDEWCPKCQAANPNDRQVLVWRVVDDDRAGLWFECDVCAHHWPYGKAALPAAADGTPVSRSPPRPR